jgi:hypothetical protein
MLKMRRIFKFINIAVRLQNHWEWMDEDPNGISPEPELEDGDIDAYLYANGHTEESLKGGLNAVLAIVEGYKGKHD